MLRAHRLLDIFEQQPLPCALQVRAQCRGWGDTSVVRCAGAEAIERRREPARLEPRGEVARHVRVVEHCEALDFPEHLADGRVIVPTVAEEHLLYCIGHAVKLVPGLVYIPERALA